MENKMMKKFYNFMLEIEKQWARQENVWDGKDFVTIPPTYYLSAIISHMIRYPEDNEMMLNFFIHYCLIPQWWFEQRGWLLQLLGKKCAAAEDAAVMAFNQDIETWFQISCPWGLGSKGILEIKSERYLILKARKSMNVSELCKRGRGLVSDTKGWCLMVSRV